MRVGWWILSGVAAAWWITCEVWFFLALVSYKNMMRRFKQLDDREKYRAFKRLDFKMTPRQTCLLVLGGVTFFPFKALAFLLVGCSNFALITILAAAGAAGSAGTRAGTEVPSTPVISPQITSSGSTARNDGKIISPTKEKLMASREEECAMASASRMPSLVLRRLMKSILSAHCRAEMYVLGIMRVKEFAVLNTSFDFKPSEAPTRLVYEEIVRDPPLLYKLTAPLRAPLRNIYRIFSRFKQRSRTAAKSQKTTDQTVTGQREMRLHETEGTLRHRGNENVPPLQTTLKATLKATLKDEVGVRLRKGESSSSLAAPATRTRERKQGAWKPGQWDSGLYAGDFDAGDYVMAQGPKCYVANHVSFIDILACIWRICPSFVAKLSVANLPLVGVCARALNCLFINRGSSHDRDLALKLLRMRQTEIWKVSASAYTANVPTPQHTIEGSPSFTASTAPSPASEMRDDTSSRETTRAAGLLVSSLMELNGDSNVEDSSVSRSTGNCVSPTQLRVRAEAAADLPADLPARQRVYFQGLLSPSSPSFDLDTPSLVVFPEGTTSNGVAVMPLKRGAFLAMRPVSPVVFLYRCPLINASYELLSMLWQVPLLLASPLPITLEIYWLRDVIPASPLEEPDALARIERFSHTVRDRMTKTLLARADWPLPPDVDSLPDSWEGSMTLKYDLLKRLR